MSTQSCWSLLKAGNRSGSAPLQVFNVDEHVDIGPRLTFCSRPHPQAAAGAVMETWGRIQDTNEC